MIKVILAAVLFSFYFIELGRFPLKWRLPAKPFGCEVCLPVWVALGLYWVPAWIIEYLIVCMAAPVVYLLLRNFVINLLNRQS